MEKIINSFTEYLKLELNLSKDNKEVIKYGMFTIVQIVTSILLIIIFGIIFKCTIESLIISFTVSILRKYSGGVHASSPERCIFLGTFICIGEALIVKYLIYINIDIELLIIIEMIIFIFSYIKIIKLAPVDNIRKPIKTIEKRKKMKEKSLIVLTIYLTIILLSIFIWNNKQINKPIIYSLCIVFGMLWQVFTLTTKGHILITKLDKQLKKII